MDEFNVQTFADTILVSSIGDYYYEVESQSNGCFSIDTISVIQTTELLLNMPNDTLVCPESTVNISVLPINNSEPTDYLWSNGATAQSISITQGLVVELSVIATTQSGCVGYDTIQIQITPPVSAEFIASSGCSDGTLQISDVSGGSGNYQYSLNEIDWQTGLAFQA